MQTTSKSNHATNDVIYIENNNLYNVLNKEVKQENIEEIESEDFEKDIIILDPKCSCIDSNGQASKCEKDLYKDHVIKEELVIGPETIQENSINLSNDKKNIVIDHVTLKTRINKKKKPKDELDKKFKCNILLCKKYFATRQYLLDHVNAVHVPKVTCELCNGSFAKKYLKRHQEYSCPMNESVKKNNQKLKYGMYSHPFICDYCDKSYTHKQSIIWHIRTQHTVHQMGRHQCHLCNKKYTKKHNLTCHIQATHLKTKKYTCMFCKKKFGWRWALTSHEKHHSECKKDLSIIIDDAHVNN